MPGQSEDVHGQRLVSEASGDLTIRAAHKPVRGASHMTAQTSADDAAFETPSNQDGRPLWGDRDARLDVSPLRRRDLASGCARRAREPPRRWSERFAEEPLFLFFDGPAGLRRRGGRAAHRRLALGLGRSLRSVASLFFALIVCFAGVAAASANSRTGERTIFAPVRIGAGGFIRGVSIAPDGTKVVKTDTYGAWTFDPRAHDCGAEAGCWRQCVTMASMPAQDRGLGLNAGVYEIVVAPNRTNVFYMYFNGRVYVSGDRCATWTRTAFPAAAANPNSAENSWGRYIAVDPANADVVFAGTPSNGVYFTANGGASWSRIPRTAIPAAARAEGQGGGNIIAFDPTSAVAGGATQGVYASSYGVGVFHTTDGGTTWAAIPSSPTTMRHMIVDQTGVVWLVDNSGGSLYRLESGEWSQTGAGSGLNGVAVNPANAKAVYAIQNGALVVSSDGGSRWTGPTRFSRVAADIPWLQTTNEDYMTAADIAFDPSQSNVLYFAEGVGVWRTNPPTRDRPVIWASQSAGVEQLVVNEIVSPWGGRGAPVAAVWDRCVFDLNEPTRYPTSAGTTNVYRRIPSGWSVDWASSDPSTIVAMCHGVDNPTDTSGYSSDGGATWTTFDSVPNEDSAGIFGGCIAASSATNFLWVSSNGGGQFYTLDAGETWTPVRGGIGSQSTGWPSAYYLDDQVCAADRVAEHTFYVYNFRTDAGGDAIFVSRDGGVSWTRQCNQCADGGSSFTGPLGVANVLRAEPGRAGALFFTAGRTGGPHPYPSFLYRSGDGGATWSTVADVREVWAFGFGAPKPHGSGIPAVFIVGWVRGEFGVWRSDDDCASWNRINDGYPNGSFDQINTIDGDSRVWGKVYIGFQGSGAAFGRK